MTSGTETAAGPVQGRMNDIVITNIKRNIEEQKSEFYIAPVSVKVSYHDWEAYRYEMRNTLNGLSMTVECGYATLVKKLDKALGL